ncbi:PREDICTED: elongation of very long chain fatty acids protein AAEL008004-like [Polistes dominula]|uniref:Elongation of very long chain fatty acids protein n=1 Tax=Polistes dominula TaxID=743375 RepID=A0ABM1IYH6_POLDO|nr:PREDICTED: elongation of very long chain fatty acids protein AAEL008004-like [Polistes dominula]XP_015185262.1 PREDICTED: elongation of very long chain fatty acids protein AAEL008004-like [Polistes dominula]XP_015185263.1 PREDICTED: elongation of very long chain fatty acids protein AAEL008004-like [Polistes dominula]
MSAIMEWYKDFMYNKNDPRTKDWFLITGPGPIITIVATYIYFSLYAGPRYMRDKKPYNLKNTLIVYNLSQIFISIYIFNESLMAGWAGHYNFYCQPIDYSDNPLAMRMARGVYTYFICKLIELLDTIFFVLRKKDKQISFLHVYHHAIMPVASWIAVRWLPGGHATFIGVINSFIHIIMYSYYLLSTLGPQIQPYLWWKKYLTSLQLIQFVLVGIHGSFILFNDCNFPKFPMILLIINAFVFIYLFGSFYVETYRKKSVKVENKNELNNTETIHNKSD